jgi:beta-N-acetylhexosaminidase
VLSSRFRIFESSHPDMVLKLKDSKPEKPLILTLLIFLCVATACSSAFGDAGSDNQLKKLTLREKIAQLIQIRVPGKFINRKNPDYQAILDQIKQNHIGGVVLFAGNVYESALLLNELQTASKLPLLVSADFERGASFRIADTTSFPWTMALGATGSEEFAYQQGLITGRESRALGVHWIFAPVMDVNNNPDNPVINIRSFGEDPMLVARLGSAFIRGAKKAGVLTTAKHFPGHGDTATDSHVGLPVVNSDMDRLQSIEFVPFRSAIDAGVDAIMTAHVAVPKITQEAKLPATLSSEILADLLQNNLHFRGLVVTDALEMAGITSQYWCGLAAIKAIQAGADVLLLPPNAAMAINEIEHAVLRGDISRQRIEQSVRKLLAIKSRMGLNRNRLVPIARIADIVSSPQSLRLAQDIADNSITVLKDARRLLPIDPTGDARILSLALTSDLESSPGSVFQSEMQRRFPFIRTLWGNARISPEWLETVDKAISESDLIVYSTFSKLVTGQDSGSIPESHRGILKKLVASGKPVVWVTFGNPYVLRIAPEIGTYLCTFSYSEPSQVATAKALSGEIETKGKMPVSIPSYSKVGDGIVIPKLEMFLKPAMPEFSEFSQGAFEKTRHLLTSFAESGVFPGAQLTIGYQGKKVLEFSAGKIGYAPDSIAVSPNTLYNLSSLSPQVGASSAGMMAIESSSLIPGATIRDYLLGLPSSSELNRLQVIDLLKRSADANPVEKDGLRNETLLEKVLSRALGISADRFLSERLFIPLGMKNTFHSRPKIYPAGIAESQSAEDASWFSNSGDLAVFAQMLLNRGVYNHRRYFKNETLMKYTGSQGLWSKPSGSDWTGNLLSPSAYGHNASNGSMFWIDPAKKLFFILLTNGPGQSQGNKIDEIQKMLAESILEQINGL